MSFGSHKGIHCFNLMRYHDVFIENTYYHQPPSIVTKSIGIYDHFRVSPIGQSLLLILVQIQYSFKVESPCNIVAWWIITIDSLVSWFTVSLVQCASHTLVHSPWETRLHDQDKCGLTFFTCAPTRSARLAFYLWKINFWKKSWSRHLFYFYFEGKIKQERKTLKSDSIDLEKACLWETWV